MTEIPAYETVIGLEVHAQLQTASKLFCGDSTAFGAEPNTQVSPVTLAHPGTLPVMNRKAIEFAVRMGLACHCEIVKNNHFARKHYFYPDLPKGYQVSQHTTPICSGGRVKITSPGPGDTKNEKIIRLNRIHLEEDAGKSIHDADALYSCIDLNRAGTPLIEIVTEPDIRSGEEAFVFLNEIRRLVRYLAICDGNMEEGSLRCDANISVRIKGDTRLGTKVEIKNLNSARNVKRAIEAESKRMSECLQNGDVIRQQTRGFDPDTGKTFPIRDKEDADDYRYFAEPDLAPFSLEDAFIDAIRKNLPALRDERIKKLTGEYKLPEYDALVLTEDRSFADFYQALADGCKNYKASANWMLGPVRSWLNERNTEISEFPLAPGSLGKLVMLVDTGKLSFTTASGKLLSLLLEEPDADPETLAVKHNLIQQSNLSELEPVIDRVLTKMPAKVAEYKKGKKGLLSLFVGEVMKETKGQADPKLTSDLLLEKLKS